MIIRTNQSILSLAVLLAAFSGLSACADERDPVDRVQPYALDKTQFVGDDLQDAADDPEFWTQGTLIDVDYGASQSGLFTSTYAQPVSRLRWQITEDMLLGRLAYERIDGTDGRGAGGSTQDGLVVVAYPIESHFDIVNQYNSTTGEQVNVREENTSDRPWYERQYMRVDWSRNENTDAYDFDTLSLVGVYGGVTYESLAYDVTDPTDPNAPVFELEDGYFDITNKAWATPETVDLSDLGWGIDSFPACFLDGDFRNGSAPSGSCNPVELTIRQSFRMVEDSDFEPRDWDGHRFQSYGGFYTERYGYARNYGMSDDLWRRFVNQQQIWERSHFYADPAAMTGAIECFTPETTPFGTDPHRDENADGTEDECAAAGAGSRCDTFKQKCTLPFVQRKQRTTAWYFAHESNQDFFESTDMATQQWDVAMRAAVRSAKYSECRALGGTEDACQADFPMWQGQMDDYQDAIWLSTEVDRCRTETPEGNCDGLADSLAAERGMSDAVASVAKMDDMIVLCHSPVEASDHPACGDRRLPADISARECESAYQAASPDETLIETCRSALNVRRGDLRYHQVNVMEEPQTPSPWGIMVDSIDPVTGETIAASINVWSHVNDLFAQGVIDKLRYIEGELETEDVTNGENIRDWATAARAAAEGNGALPMMDRAGLDQRMAEFAGGDVPIDRARIPRNIRNQVREVNRDLSQVRAALGTASSNSAIYAARREQAMGTEFEAELMTPMLQQLHGIDGLPLNNATLNIASPLRGGNPSFQRELEHLKEHALGQRGACILHADEAAAPFSLVGLAEVLQEKFGAFNPDDDTATQQARAERMVQFVAQRAHFSVMAHEMGHSIGLRHNFVSSSDPWQYRPQYWQLRTQNGQNTTPCDDLATDGESCVGPRYFDPVTENESKNLIWMWMQSSIMDYAGELTQDMIGLGIYDFAAARMLHGETVAVLNEDGQNAASAQGQMLIDQQDTFGGILGISYEYAGDDIHYSQLQNNIPLISDCQVVDPQLFKPAAWDEERDGIWSPLIDGLMVQVNGEWTRCRSQQVDYVRWESMAPTDDTSGPQVDMENRPRMPYGFATDGWADLGNLSVYRHDNGADPYEIFNFMITSQEVWHVFDQYRRGRQGFSVRSASNRTLRRYNEKLRDGAKGLGLIKNIYRTFALEQGYDFDTFWPIASNFFPENILASSVAFDHITRTMARPESGAHYRTDWEEVLRSARDTTGTPGRTLVTIPTGATGYNRTVGIGGALVENELCRECGEYDSQFTMNAGSYYDKMYSAMLLTESVDNFISSSRTDFVDPRYRAVSLADLFPEGYRRWLGNNLTNDEMLKGARVAADGRNSPLLGADGFPSQAIGWTSWWGESPRACFPGDGTTLCSSFDEDDALFNPNFPANTAVIDAQVGWEQQKFLIAYTMLYLPENQETNWLDQMTLWEKGSDDPGFERRIEFHSPNGTIYVAKTLGTEVIFGQTVQRGVAARVLEYANQLLFAAYETTPGPDLDSDGNPDWYVPVYSDTTGQPIVRWDDTVALIDDAGLIQPDGIPGCDATDNSICTCTSNRSCVELGHYLSVPAYLRDALTAYQLGHPDTRGVF